MTAQKRLINLSEAKYVIDTSSLTTMRRVYPVDVFPGVWNKLDELADNGTLVSVDPVLRELEVQDDVVTAWARQHESAFVPLDDAIQEEATRILAAHPGLVDLKQRKGGADPFVIACARVNSCAVVTEENKTHGSARVKIPNVCDTMNLKCLRLLEMLRLEGLKL
jgi:hypothetical protein